MRAVILIQIVLLDFDARICPRNTTIGRLPARSRSIRKFHLGAPTGLCLFQGQPKVPPFKALKRAARISDALVLRVENPGPHPSAVRLGGKYLSVEVYRLRDRVTHDDLHVEGLCPPRRA